MDQRLVSWGDRVRVHRRAERRIPTREQSETVGSYRRVDRGVARETRRGGARKQRLRPLRQRWIGLFWQLESQPISLRLRRVVLPATGLVARDRRRLRSML